MNFKEWNETMLSEDAEFKHLGVEQKEVRYYKSKVEEMKKSLESVKSSISFLKNNCPNELWTHQETENWEDVADDAIKEIEEVLKGE